MKKKIPIPPAIACFLAIFLYCCGGSQQEKETINQTAIEQEDSLDIEVQVEDTLRLEEGTIPEGWQKTDLGLGYYVAFPKKPKKSEYKKKNQVAYKTQRSRYTLLTTVTDLTTDSSFLANRQRKEDYYKAVFDDLVQDLDGLELVEDDEVQFIQLYKGRRARFKAIDLQIFAQCVIIGNNAYSMSCILWKEESIALLQMKDKFLYSFGKELYIE